MQPLSWEKNGLKLLDQRRLPAEIRFITCRSADDVAAAITGLAVRGAPLIGIAAAFGIVLEAFRLEDAADWEAHLQQTAALLKACRPTAVNLAWAVDRMLARLPGSRGLPNRERAQLLAEEAQSILREDQAAGRAIADFGAPLIPRRATILTHCNAGALATGGPGTALAVIRAACAQGKEIRVYAGETRPVLQGARLTAFELLQERIPVCLITDSCAGYLFSRRMIDLVIVGADRIALNGDTANKIGTYTLAVLAHTHGIPFYIAAPTSTFDEHIESGEAITIEQRDPEEVLTFNGIRIAPDGLEAFNPAFDITPAALITALITDRGLVRAPFREQIASILRSE